jgi:hypothetical protein
MRSWVGVEGDGAIVYSRLDDKPKRGCDPHQLA